MKVISIFSFLFLASICTALDAKQLGHIPPGPFSVVPKEGIELQLPARDYKRARVLVASMSGYKVVEMARAGDLFSAKVQFQDLAILKYQFQIETVGGNFDESEYFTINQPAGADTEKDLLSLTSDLEQLRAKQSQLENAVFGLKQTDPETLAKRKNQELARALLILTQKERELASKKGEPR